MLKQADEKEKGDEQVKFRRESKPVRIIEAGPAEPEDVHHADDENQHGVFVKADEGIHDTGDRDS